MMCSEDEGKKTLVLENEEVSGEVAALNKLVADLHLDAPSFCDLVAAKLGELSFGNAETRAQIQVTLRDLQDDLARQDAREGTGPEGGSDIDAILATVRSRGLTPERACAVMMALILGLRRACPAKQLMIDAIAVVALATDPGARRAWLEEETSN
jgi:hypothetical protein